MKRFKRIFKVLLMLLVLLLLAVTYYYQSHKPNYKGKIALNNLQDNVTTYFDTHGVPHIYANNQDDAYRTLGYLHAQDRLWQMELVSRIATGRLSEIFGKDALENDTFFIGLGIPEAAKQTISKLDKKSEGYSLLEAYLDGVNQYVDESATPLEFQLLGIEKHHYAIEDIYNVFGYISFSFAMAHKTDPLMSAMEQKLGAKYMQALPMNYVAGTTMIHSFHQTEETLTRLTKKLNKIWGDDAITPAFIGSNAWVVSPKKSASGKVILNNDPHIMYSQPATWYMSHIVTPNFELYGYNLALTPFALLGHNHNYAYGLTMFENDDIDFFEETVNPANENQYKTEAGWEDFKTRTYTIKVKDAKDVVVAVKRSRNGVIMNDLVPSQVLNTQIPAIENSNPIAMQWIYTEIDNNMLEASYLMTHSNSLAEFKKGAALINAPGLNVMYGDAKGNIAWFAAAKLYTYTNKVSRKGILNGVTDNQKIYYDFYKNPQAINPPNNYVFSANNQPSDTINGNLYPGYYLPEYRAKRIVNLLDNKNDWTVSDFKTMITDVTSSVDKELAAILLQSIDKSSLSNNELQAIKELASWDASYRLNSIAATIFTKFKYTYIHNTYADEMGEENFELFINTHIYKRAIAYQLKSNTTNIWWDNVKTTGIRETKIMVLNNAFHQTIEKLEKQLGTDMSEWQWKNVHILEHQHPFGQIPALRKYFNVGPFPMDGSNEVINNSIFHANDSGLYHTIAGPSTRRIIDFADVEHGQTILPTGQSGNIFSKHYKDLALKYNKGEFIPMLLNKDEIINESTKLVFSKK